MSRCFIFIIQFSTIQVNKHTISLSLSPCVSFDLTIDYLSLFLSHLIISYFILKSFFNLEITDSFLGMILFKLVLNTIEFELLFFKRFDKLENIHRSFIFLEYFLLVLLHFVFDT